MGLGRTGYAYAIVAYLLWGVFPLYFRLMRPSEPVEILAQRVVWCLVFTLAIIAVTRRWRRLTQLRDGRTLGILGLASIFLAVNWGTYIYAVNSGHVVESSLGYFINPLVTVIFGVLLGERLRPAQWVAIGVATAAVGVLTVDYGHLPVIALTLAVSFGLYGLAKSRVSVAAVDGLALESAFLVLPAVGYLVFLGQTGQGTFGRVSVAHTLVLLSSGVVTAVPLLAFAAAAKRLPLSVIGLLQYLTPILQLGCGVLILGEPMPPARLVGFGLVWVALAVFTVDGLRRLRSVTRQPAPVPDGATR